MFGVRNSDAFQLLRFDEVLFALERGCGCCVTRHATRKYCLHINRFRPGSHLMANIVPFLAVEVRSKFEAFSMVAGG